MYVEADGDDGGDGVLWFSAKLTQASWSLWRLEQTPHKNLNTHINILILILIPILIFS
jgi:hypothetical protein